MLAGPQTGSVPARDPAARPPSRRSPASARRATRPAPPRSRAPTRRDGARSESRIVEPTRRPAHTSLTCWKPSKPTWAQKTTSSSGPSSMRASGPPSRGGRTLRSRSARDASSGWRSAMISWARASFAGVCARSLRVDEDALVAPHVARERAQRGDLARGVRRRAPHVVGGHPAAADVDGGQRLELALDHEPQPHPVLGADDDVGQHVVDDAGVAHHDQHRSRARLIEALDLEAQAEEHADPAQVAAGPVDSQVVEPAPAAQRAAAERPAARTARSRRARRWPASRRTGTTTPSRPAARPPSAFGVAARGPDRRPPRPNRATGKSAVSSTKATISIAIPRTRRASLAANGPSSANSGPAATSATRTRSA